MTKKNSVFHKALSVVLTVVMVFGYVGLLSGVIGKDLFGTAQVAHAATANSYATLQNAINSANNTNGTTTIQLTANITGGKVAALPAITKNVILDLNGYSITFESNKTDLGNNDNNNNEQQIPSDLVASYSGASDAVNKGVINVGSSGWLQIINSSGTSSTFSVKTYAYGDDSNGHHFTGRKTTTWMAAASAIYCEGTLVLGDKNNSSYDNFTIKTQARAGTDNDGYDKRCMATNSYAVTMNHSNAKLSMYGGTLESSANNTSNYNGTNDMRCFALNINSCYSADIYKGTINIPHEDRTGIVNADGNDSSGGNNYLAAIRVNTPYVYIFDLSSTVKAEASADTEKANIYAANIYATNSNNAPYVYGFALTNTSSKSSSDSAYMEAANILGDYKLAINGNICPDTKFGSNLGFTSAARADHGLNANSNNYLYTLFHFGDTVTENGVYPWSYATFRDYVGAHTATNDAYFANSASHMNDGNNYAASAAGNYYRNGYRHTGWKGAKMPGDPSNASTSMTSTSAATLNASNGGSLFLYPTWSLVNYDITYDLNTNDGKQGSASNASGAPTTYNITSTSTLPVPTRHGYYFKGWILTKKAYNKIGGGTISSDAGNPTTLNMSESYDSVDPWTLDNTYKPWWNGSAYTAGQSLTGKNGHIWLKATWEETPYKATFNYDNIPAGATGLAATPNGQVGYNVNNTFTFPQNATKPYYTFNGTNNGWKVTTPDGSWSSGAPFNAGASTSVGNYGNPTFTAQYTPIQYTITFDPNGGGDVKSNFSDTISNKYHYNYESKTNLPAIGRLGYTFGGWKPETTVTEEWDSSQIVWDQNATYSGTSVEHKHGDVTLVAQWNTVSSKVHYVLGTGEYLSGADQNPTYSFDSEYNFALDTANKIGYNFVGWRIIPPSGSGNTYYNNYYEQYEDDNNVTVAPANRWSVTKDEGQTDYSLDSGNFVLPKGKIGDVWLAPEFTPITYTLIYNANGGSACAPKSYTIEDSFTLDSTSQKGYAFSGWSAALTDAGSGAVHNWTASSYNFGSQVTGMYGNVTLTAQKTPANYTITLDVNGGDPLENTVRPYTVENSVDLPQDLSRTGYSFVNWQVAGGDELAADSIWKDDESFARTFTDKLPAGCYGNVKLVAQWEHKSYRIDKESYDDQYYFIDVPFTLGGAPLPGYTFVNWTVLNSIGNWVQGTEYTATQNISGMWGDVALHPNFTPNTYTITYNDKDGNPAHSETYTIETDITLDDGGIDGYAFGGWVVSGLTAESSRWISGDKMPQGEYGTGFYGDVTLTPDLTPADYTVKFISDGGTTYPDLPYTIEGVAEGFSATLPTPTKTGYDFTGWKVTTAAGGWTDGDVIPAGTSVVGKWGSVTLTAQWSAKSIPVKYIVGNTAQYPDGITKQGTFNEIAPDLTNDEKAKPADAQYTYTFDHWEPALGRITREDPQYVYTAVYSQTVNKYTVTWMIPTDVNGTPGNYTAQVSDPIEYGNAPVYNDGVNPTLDSANPAEYTWRFAGWSLTPGGEKLESLPTVTGNATYYALYTKVLRPEIVNWVINGVTNSEEWGIGETPEWKHETPTKPDENGYAFTFTKWDPAPVPVVQRGGPYTYTALFSSYLQTYTVTLNVNGGETADPLSFTYQMGDTVTFPNPTRTGYLFAGWQLDAAVGTWTARTVRAGDYTTNTLWGSVSFTAQWTPIEYTVNFNGASEDDVLPTPLTYTIESDSALPAATREGHVLSGWIVSVGGGNWTQGATLAANYTLAENYGNVTLTPIWQVQTYTIHWISGDYEQTSEAEYGSAILAYTPISKMGYTADWDAEVPATMPASDLTFHAVYTPVQYYIRLNANGGSEVENFYYTIDGNNTLPTPTRDGATFRGWKVAAAQGNWSKNTLVAGGASLNGKYGNVSLTAQWDLEQHTVTWVAGDVTKETVWLYGAVPSYDGTPYKSPDEHNSYVFSGWDKTIVPVTEDVTYTALFTPTVRTYTVRWVVDGFTAKVKEDYHYGDMPVYDGETPTRDSTPYFDFSFAGWSPEVTEVTKDVTYTAQFNVFTKLQSLTLDVSSMFLEIGEGESLGVTLNPTNASVRDVLWTSQNKDVATIDANGRITAVAPGVSVIKVASVDNSKSAYCVVTVAPRHTKYVEITAGGISTTQLAGAMLQLSATIQPDNATDTGIRWSSGDVSVATVDGNGLVKYVGVGETDITAIASDGFSMGSIHVVTTTDETEVENEVKTYLVTFGEFYPGFKFTENGEHYTAGRLYVAEGETIRFKLDVQNSRQSGYSVYANTELMSCDADYWYTLDNIQNNMIIRFADSAAGIGTPEEEDGGDSGAKLTFFERLAAFFRKIVEFFRGLFKK